MAKYYGLQRSDDFLAHYGIRGMKWGVRKAIASGNEKRLARNYAKASKKLAKLNDKTNISKQEAAAKKYNKVAKIGAAVGGLGLGSTVGLHGAKQVTRLMTEHRMGKAAQAHEAYRNALNANNYTASDAYRTIHDSINERANKSWRQHLNADRAIESTKSIRYPMMAIGLSTAAVAKTKAHLAKKRTTQEGHAKAVSKRDEFQREMNKAFAGTKYAKKRERG